MTPLTADDWNLILNLLTTIGSIGVAMIPVLIVTERHKDKIRSLKMCEPVSFSDYWDGVRTHNEAYAALAELEAKGLCISKAQEEEIRREVDRVRQEANATVPPEAALVSLALPLGPDTTYWLWVAGLGAVASIVYLLRMVP